jgi:GntR family transcriptional regulator
MEMEISLSKSSEVPLRQQLAEQIVIAIATGQVRAGERMPSVRALARQMKIHHNTVSEAYQDLVRRKWLTRQRGTRLIVGDRVAEGAKKRPETLDELIDESIESAREMGFTLQALTQRVRERLLVQPPDHILVVSEEEGLRELIRAEVRKELGETVETCSPEEFASNPAKVVGAQIFAPVHIIHELKARFAVPITYSKADEHARLIRALKTPSIIAAVSVSESLLLRARSMFAAAVGRRHTYQEILLAAKGSIDLGGVDLAFCDSLSLGRVDCRRKVVYALVSGACLKQFSAAMGAMKRPRS